MDDDDSSHTVRVDVSAYQEARRPLERGDTVIDQPSELPSAGSEGPATLEQANPFASFDQLANSFQENREMEARRAEAARRIAEEHQLEAERRMLQDRRLEEARRENEERRLEAQRRAEEQELREKQASAAEAERLEEERLIEDERRRQEKRIEDARRENEERRQQDADRLTAEQRAEDVRREEEDRLAVARRRQDDARQEEQRAEAQRVEAEWLAEAARIDQERREREARSAEERRAAEEDRLAAERRREEDERLEEERRLEADRVEAEWRAEAARIEDERRAEEHRREEERAENDRLAAERRREEDERLDEERRAEDARREEEARLDEERRAEDARREEEARLDEERRAEDARREEERAENDRQAAAQRREEDARLEEEQRAEEQRREEARAENDRQAAERRREEDARLEEERRAEDARADELRRVEAERAEEARREDERAENQRRAQKMRLEEERVEAARLEEARAEAERLEQARADQERREEEARLEDERRAEEEDRLASERRAEEDAARQREEDERLAAARREADEAHAAAERRRAEESYQREQERLESERIAATERIEAERRAREEQIERLAAERRAEASRRERADADAEAAFFGEGSESIAAQPRGIEPRRDTILDDQEERYIRASADEVATRIDVPQSPNDVLGSDTQRITSRPEPSGDVEAVDLPEEDAQPISDRERSGVTASPIDASDAVMIGGSWADVIGPASSLPAETPARLSQNDTFDEDEDEPTHAEASPAEPSLAVRPNITGPIPQAAFDERPTEHADALLETGAYNQDGATEIVRALGSVDRARTSSGLRDPTDISVRGVDSDKPERASSESDAAPSSRPPPRVGPYRPVIERDHAEVSIPDPAELSRPPARAPSKIPPAPPVATEPPAPVQQKIELQRSDFSEEVTQVPPERLNEPVPSTTRLARDEQSGKEPQTTGDLSSAHVAGIDFGGRWVRVGRLKQGELELISSGGSPYIPALVAVRSDGTLAVGAKARTIFLDDPTRAVAPRTILRAMKGGGIDPSSRLTNVSVENGKVFVDLGVRSVDLHEILVAFFSSIRSMLAAHFGSDNIRALISIPNDLDPEARTLLKEATKEAKLPNVKLYSEVEAVIRAYNLEAQPIETMLMVDVGATHVGLAVARRGRDGFAVVGSRWIDELSASELDARVVDLTLNELNQQAKEDHRSDLGVRIRLLEAVEKARTDIRRNATVELKASLPAPGGASNVGVERSIKLSRGRIYQVTEDSVRQICLKIQELLRDVGVHPRALGAIVLAGSAGLYPPLVQAISSLTTKEPLTSVPSAHVFALGLARGGAAMEKPEAAALRPDALSSSIGIQLPGGRFMPLLKMGEQLPAKLRRRHSTTRDNQTEIELEIYQGEGELVRTCTKLGTIVLHNVPKGPRGAVNVELAMEVDMDEVITVTLSEPSSGNKTQVVLPGKKTPAQRRAVVAAQQSAQEGKKEAPKRGGLLSRLLGRS